MTHRHSGLSQKIAVTSLTFLLGKQFVPRHATPGRKILAHSWISGAHFEYRPILQAFHRLLHEQEETSATPLVSSIAHGTHGNLLPIPSTKNIDRHEKVLYMRETSFPKRKATND
jgi:hypothetical protein